MAIVLAGAPHGGLEMIRTSLPLLIGKPVTLETMASEIGSASLGGPYPVYTVSRSAVVEHSLLATANAAGPDGWAYVVSVDNHRWTAELSVRNAELSIGAFYPDSHTATFIEAIHRAEQIDAADHSDRYELRVLSVPSLDLVAVWMRGAHHNLLLPVHPAPPAVMEKSSYTEEELTNNLLDLAHSRLTKSDKGM